MFVNVQILSNMTKQCLIVFDSQTFPVWTGLYAQVTDADHDIAHSIFRNGHEFSSIRNSTTTHENVQDKNIVVTIPEDLELTEAETSVLI